MKKSQIKKGNKKSLKEASERIKRGELVAFPTETVYGLGANALDEEACLRIFQMKKRPLSDPLIVHCKDMEQVKSCIKLDENEERILDVLGGKFWPGPITLIFRKSEQIPLKITADTGFVGVRIPRSKVALELIRASGVPIAAPSANLFNHVSPVTAKHVQSDFPSGDLLILDDGQTTLGMESSVIKVANKAIQVI